MTPLQYFEHISFNVVDGKISVIQLFNLIKKDFKIDSFREFYRFTQEVDSDLNGFFFENELKEFLEAEEKAGEYSTAGLLG